MHIIIGVILTWFAVIVVMLMWEGLDDPVYNFEDHKEPDHE